MTNLNKISFSIKDKVFGENLDPSNLTLPLLAEFIDQVSLFIKGDSRKDLSTVKTSIEEGSLMVTAHDNDDLFLDAFEDYLLINEKNSLSGISRYRANIIEKWQEHAKENKDRVYNVSFDDEDSTSSNLVISSETNYVRKKDIWIDVELYLYGKIYDMGGKTNPNVHVELDNGRSLTVSTDATTLLGEKKNLLYKKQLVRIKAQENIDTKELRGETLVSFENYNPVFNEEEFELISSKAREAWSSVRNASQWVDELRGSNA